MTTVSSPASRLFGFEMVEAALGMILMGMFVVAYGLSRIRRLSH